MLVSAWAHWLRHTAGSHMTDRQVDPRFVRDNFGHSSAVEDECICTARKMRAMKPRSTGIGGQLMSNKAGRVSEKQPGARVRPGCDAKNTSGDSPLVVVSFWRMVAFWHHLLYDSFTPFPSQGKKAIRALARGCNSADMADNRNRPKLGDVPVRREALKGTDMKGYSNHGTQARGRDNSRPRANYCSLKCREPGGSTACCRPIWKYVKPVHRTSSASRG